VTVFFTDCDVVSCYHTLGSPVVRYRVSYRPLQTNRKARNKRKLQRRGTWMLK